MAITRIDIKKHLNIFLIVLIFYLTHIEARCRRFDEKALDHINFNKLSGLWNIVYSSDTKLDTSCSHIIYRQKEGTHVNFNIFNSQTQNTSGTILNNDSKRMQIKVDGIRSTFWILDTDYRSFLLTYQCTKEVVNGHKSSKEVYRILSREITIDTHSFQKISSILSGISHNIHIKPVSQSNCETIDDKCEEFEDKAVKDLDLKKLTGYWNLLFTTDSDSDQSCTGFQNSFVSDNSLEFVKDANCFHISNGLISKGLPKDQSLKLISTTGNTTSTLWVLDTDYINYLLYYKCSKQQVNGLIQIKDVYRILGRNQVISESSLQNSELLLKSISNDIHLHPIIQSNCNCKPTYTPFSFPSLFQSQSQIQSQFPSQLQSQSQSQFQSQAQPQPFFTIESTKPLQSGKRCHIFEDKSIKNQDLRNLTGHWNLLFSTDSSESKCTYLESNLKEINTLELIKYVNCHKDYNGLILKCSATENSSKLSYFFNGITYNIWNLDIGSADNLFIYQCTEQDVNGITQISENYKIFARNKTVSEPIMQKIEDVLNTIPGEIVLNPLSRNHCDCDLLKTLTSSHSNDTSVNYYINSSLTTDKEPEIKSCRNFEHISAKDLDFNTLRGHWYLLFSTNNLTSNCTYAEIDLINPTSIEFNLYVECVKNMSALITKFPPEDKTSKLLFTSGNSTSYIWNLETGSAENLLTYQCSQQDVNGIKQISETYRIYGRKDIIPEPILQNIENILNSNLKRTFILNPLPESGCNCKLTNSSNSSQSISTQKTLPTTVIQPEIKKCRNFEDISVKNLDLETLSGQWNLLFSTNKLVTKCTYAQIDVLNKNSLEFNLYVDCVKNMNALVSKCSPKDKSSKLLFTSDNSTSFLWNLETGSADNLLTYQCSQQDVNGIKQISESYGIFARKAVIPEPILHQIKNILNSISKNIILNPLSQSGCDCSLTKSITSSLPENIYSITTSRPLEFSKCRDFEDNAVKSLDIKRFSGRWELLFSSANSDIDLNCIHAEFNPINSSSFGVKQFVDCAEIGEGIISINSQNNSAKLLVNANHQTFDSWVLSLNYSDYLLIYQCSKHNNNDVYKIFGRKSNIAESVLQNLETELNSISNDIIMNPISRSNCKCDQPLTITPSSTISTPTLPQITSFITLGPSEIPKCRDFEDKAVKNLDIKMLSGHWKLLFSTSNSETVHKCVNADINQINSESFEILRRVDCNQDTNGLVYKSSPKDNSAKLLINALNITLDLWFLSLDYNDYALVYECSKDGFMNAYKIVGRKNTITESVLEQLELQLNSISNDIVMMPVSHSNCKCEQPLTTTPTLSETTTIPPLPPITTSSPLTFSKCRDFEDKAVKNLNIEKFSGHWEVLYSTSNSETVHKCVNADINQINSESFEIVRRVDCDQFASALVSKSSPNDNSAKWLLNAFNKTINLWILSLDYSDYALIYQCFKDDHNSVYKILGRKNTISESVIQQLELQLNSISNEIVMTPISHFDCKCEQPLTMTSTPSETTTINPLPLNVNPIIQIPDNYSVTSRPLKFSKCRNFEDKAVRNLDFEMLSGHWKVLFSSINSLTEVKCINQEFNRINSQSIEFVQHIDCEQTANGIASKSSPQDNSAKLFINSYNNNKSVELWILSLDYSDYVLAYECSENDFEIYSILGRKCSIDESVLRRLENKLYSISKDIVMTQHSQSNCLCNQPSTFTPSILPSTILETNINTDSVELVSNSATVLYKSQTLEPILHNTECRKFEAVKNLDFKKLSGDWKLLFSSDEKSDSSCTQLEFNPINSDSLEFTKSINCSNSKNGLVSKFLPNEKSAKLVLTAYNTTYNLWVLALDYSDYMLTYQCSKHDNNGIIHIKEMYKIYGRKNIISESALQQLENILNTISNDIILNPISQSKCECEEKILTSKNIGVYGKSNKSQEALPTDSSAKLTELEFKDKLYNHTVSEGCPKTDGLGLKSYNWKQLSGKWYRIYSTDETKCINFEIEKSKSKPSAKRYFIKRQSTDLLSTGFLRLEPNGELTSNSMDEKPSLYHVIATDYDNYLITYRCLSNEKIEVNILSRGRDLDQKVLDLAHSKLNAVGIDLIIKPVDQTNCEYDSNEVLSCKDFRDKALVKVDLKRFHGVWYPILLNQPGARCLKVQDNRKAASDPLLKEEYWYDVVDESGIQGFGRIKANEDGRLSELNFNLEGDRRITVLDTDYDNYQVYYQCAIANIDGKRRKIIEYGVMGRKQSVDNSIISKARKIFDDIGLEEVHPVDQEKCQFTNIGKRPGINDYHCKNVESFVVKNVDLDKLTGKWYGLYAHHSGQIDVSIEFSKNSNTSSEYSHSFQTRYDDHVFRGGIRLDKSGFLYATSSNHPSMGEFKYNILDVNYNNNLIIYKCVQFDGSLSKLEKFHVLSRNCSLCQSVRDRATQMIRDLGFEDNLSEITQYQCRTDLKYESHVLTKSCHHFHNPEVIDLDFARISGRWDLQLMSNSKKPFDYNIAKAMPYNQIEITFYKDFKALSTQVWSHIKESNLIKHTVGDFGIKAVVSTDYSSYLLSYSCQEYEENGLFRASESLCLTTRSNTSVKVDDFSEMFAEMPAISLNKVIDLIGNLTIVKSDKYILIGEKVKHEVIDLVKNYQRENQLSNQSDKDVYHSLNKVGRHFSEEELASVDLSTLAKNWSLDFTTYANEKIPFDRVEITRKPDNTLNVALLNKKQLIANAINYHSNNSKIMLSFLEGRRGRVINLLATHDYRVTYFCDEYEINGVFTGKEILRLYSSDNSVKPRDWYSYLEVMFSKMNRKTWDKIDDLLQKLNPVKRGCFDKNLSINSIKTLLSKYLTPKLRFEHKVHKELPISKKGDKEVFESLNKVCKHFDEEELIETSFSKLSGIWRLDWSSWDDHDMLRTFQIIEIKPETDQLTQLKVSPSLNSKISARGYAIHNMGTKYDQNTVGGRRRRAATFYSDDDYLIIFFCIENEIDNQITGNELFTLYSRNISTKPKDLNTYIEIMANNLQPKTLAKISHTLNRLIPQNISTVDEQIKPYIKRLTNRAMPKEVVKEKLTIAEDLYNKFVAKGLVTKQINTILADREVSVRSDEEVYGSLIKVCHTFEDNELEEMHYLKLRGRWNIDWSSSCKVSFPFDSFDNQIVDSSSMHTRYFLNSEVVAIAEMTPEKGSKFNRRVVDGRRGRVGLLWSGCDNAIVYSCSENQINGTIIGKEVLRFISRSNISHGTDLNVYIEKLLNYVKPITLAKISDLIANLRPVENDILNKDCHLPKQITTQELSNGIQFDLLANIDLTRFNRKVSDRLNSLEGISNQSDSEVYDILEQNCRAFDQKDLVKPMFNRVQGVWRVDYASWINNITPYDTLEFKDRGDHLYIYRSFSSKVVSHGSAHHINGSRYLRQNIDGRRGIEAYLWTEYTDHLILYLCQENYVNGVLKTNEVLRLLSRPNTTKGNDLEAYENLILSDIKDKVSDIITDLVASLRPIHNESNVQNISVNAVKVEVSINTTEDENSCPNYDNISEKDIDFSRLTGRWDAIYTSNNRIDKSCVYAIDSYNNTSDTINSVKHSNNKTNIVVILHSTNNGRQLVIVDNTVFQSWILATDYSTYKLAYTCYVKQVNGKKRRIDLERLYIKGIEATDFDKHILGELREKSALIGKILEPIERSNCTQSEKWEND